MIPSSFDEWEIRKRWKDIFPAGKDGPFRLKSFKQIDSTNSEAKRDAESGASSGHVYLACRQTQGRGCQDHTWHSDDTGGIYCSILFRPMWPVSQGLLFVRLSALAVYDALADMIAMHGLPLLSLTIKPPNDILLAGKKLGGILVESASQGESICYAVVGIGVNVNQTVFPRDIADRAISLFLAYGIFFDQSLLLTSLLNRLWSYYEKLDLHGAGFISERWTTITGEKE